MKKKSKKNYHDNWILKITSLAFIISFCFSLASEIVVPKVNVYIGLIIVLIVIIIGVIFDMVGVAVTASDITSFHSMSARKVRGAKKAVKLKKNAEKVSSFCNDVIGDICGIISGWVGATISVLISSKTNMDVFIVTMIVMAMIAALTIGGKALGKGIAIKKSNTILYEFAKVLSLIVKDQ